MISLADIYPEQAQTLNTSIRIFADGLSFYAQPKERLDAEQQQKNFLTFSADYNDSVRNEEEGLKELFFQHPQLAYPYAETKIFIEPSRAMLIPHDLVRPEDMKDIKVGLSQERGRETVYTTISSPVKSELAMDVSSDLLAFALRSFSNPKVLHVLQPMVAHAIQVSAERKERVLLALFTGYSLEVVLAHQGKLLMANGFDLSSFEEIKYYITYIWRAMELDAATDFCCFVGDDAVSDLFMTYFKDRIPHLDVKRGERELAAIYMMRTN